MPMNRLLWSAAVTSVVLAAAPVFEGTPWAETAAAAADSDLPPPAQQRTVRVGGRILNVRLSAATYLAGVPGEGAQVQGNTYTQVSITSADGRPLQTNAEAPRLFLRLKKKWVRIPLQLIPTTAMNPQDGAYYAGTLAQPLEAGTTVAALVQVNARRAWGRADFRELVVGSAGPAQ